jgi:hypothetical protein
MRKLAVIVGLLLLVWLVAVQDTELPVAKFRVINPAQGNVPRFGPESALHPISPMIQVSDDDYRCGKYFLCATVGGIAGTSTMVHYQGPDSRISQGHVIMPMDALVVFLDETKPVPIVAVDQLSNPMKVAVILSEEEYHRNAHPCLPRPQ